MTQSISFNASRRNFNPPVQDGTQSKVSTGSSTLTNVLTAAVGILAVSQQITGATAQPVNPLAGGLKPATRGLQQANATAVQQFCSGNVRAADTTPQTQQAVAQLVADCNDIVAHNTDFLAYAKAEESAAAAVIAAGDPVSPSIGITVIGAKQFVNQTARAGQFMERLGKDTNPREVYAAFFPRAQDRAKGTHVIPINGHVIGADVVDDKTWLKAYAAEVAHWNMLRTDYNPTTDPNLCGNIPSLKALNGAFVGTSVAQGLGRILNGLAAIAGNYPDLELFPNGKSYAAEGYFPKGTVPLLQDLFVSESGKNAPGEETFSAFVERLPSILTARHVSANDAAVIQNHYDNLLALTRAILGGRIANSSLSTVAQPGL